MRRAAALLCFTLGFTATAATETWVSLACKLSWQAPTTGGEVQGYWVYIEPAGGQAVKANVGNVTEVTCKKLGILEGTYKAWVTAYNPVGESEASNIVPFVLIVSAPAPPNGVGVSDG